MDPMAPSEGWWGGTVTLNLTASIIHGAAYVVTPREIGRLTDAAVCGRPIRIQNGFFEYLQFGRGVEPKACRSELCGSQLQAYERDNAVTFAPLLATPQQVRIYPTDIRDTALRVLLQGKDQNGQIILTTDPSTGQAARRAARAGPSPALSLSLSLLLPLPPSLPPPPGILPTFNGL